MPRLEFWYDLASNYSYLSAMRIDAMGRSAGVEIVWKPFLLGPIFKARGWETSPFNVYPDKGRNMVRDMQRTCEDRSLPFVMPKPFPARSLLAVSVAHCGEADDWTPQFSRAAFSAEFARGEDISSVEVVEALLSGLGLDADAVMTLANSEACKTSLRVRTGEAQAHGIFGAPSFITESGELFWGDDRLEQAIRWAKR